MLTQRMQIKAIANLLAGMPDSHRPKQRDFQEPWLTAYKAIMDAIPGEVHQALITAFAEHPDRNSIIGAILSELPGPISMAFPSLQEIAAQLTPIEWLWPGWIPRGLLSMLGAVQGAGKSYLALDLARLITNGGVFPDGAPIPCAGGNVVYVDAENIPSLHNERAEAWRMDRSKIFMMLPTSNEILIDLTQQQYRDRLIELVFATQPELVIIDSLGQSSSRGENTVEDVREILGFLNALAADFQCGVVLVHHLRKRNPLDIVGEIELDDFRGSSQITALTRSVLGMSVIQTGPEKDPNGPRKLSIIKTNLGRYPDPIGVEFVPMHPKGVFLRYGDVPSPFKEPGECEICAEWLVKTLEDNGPLPAAEIVEMAKAAGYSRFMIYKARASLDSRIHDTAGPKKTGNKWELVSEDNSDDETDEM